MIVLSHPEWWLDHVDELVEALTIAAQAPERDEPVHAGDAEVVLSDPAWWLEHVDELADALATAAATREHEADGARSGDPESEPAPQRRWGDVDAMIARRQEQAAQRQEPEHQAEEQRQQPEPEHTWVDLDALREQRTADPAQEQRPPDHDRDIGR